MADNTNNSNASKVVTAGALGVALGAAGVILSKKENRKVVADKLESVRKWSENTVAEWKAKMEEVEDDTSDMAVSVKDKASSTAEDITDDLESEASADQGAGKHLN